MRVCTHMCYIFILCIYSTLFNIFVIMKLEINDPIPKIQKKVVNLFLPGIVAWFYTDQGNT